jgi:hypothetical protein
VVFEISCNGLRLVVGDGIYVAEAATGREGASVGMAGGVDDCRFGLMRPMARIDFGGTDVGEVGAAVGPGGAEDGVVSSEAAIWSAISGGTGNTIVTGCVEDGDALKAEFQESEYFCQMLFHGYDEMALHTHCIVFADSMVGGRTPGHHKTQRSH